MMVFVTENILIDYPANEVFTYIANYENDLKWRAGVFEMQHDPPGNVHVGTTTREVMRFMGRNTINYAEIVEYEDGHKSAFKTTSGPISAAGYRLVEHDGQRSRLTYQVQSELSGVYKMFSPAIVWMFRRRLQTDLERLKEILESNN